MAGRVVQDSSAEMLKAFSGDARKMFAHHLQQPVTTFRQGLMACRQLGIVDKNVVRKVCNSDLAAKVRLLTKPSLRGVAAEAVVNPRKNTASLMMRP